MVILPLTIFRHYFEASILLLKLMVRYNWQTTLGTGGHLKTVHRGTPQNCSQGDISELFTGDISELFTQGHHRTTHRQDIWELFTRGDIWELFTEGHLRTAHRGHLITVHMWTSQNSSQGRHFRTVHRGTSQIDSQGGHLRTGHRFNNIAQKGNNIKHYNVMVAFMYSVNRQLTICSFCTYAAR